MEIEKSLRYINDHLHVLMKAEKDPGKNAALVRISHGLTQLQGGFAKLEQRIQALESNALKP